MTRLAAIALLAFGLAAPAAAETCGADKDDPCETPLGSYYLAAPESGADGKPVVLFFHGGGGWGSRIFSMRGAMTEIFIRRGYAVIAPNGKKRPGSRFGPGWAFIPQFEPHRDDLAFTREVLADAADRFGVDQNRVLLTGYSIGGSIASYLACRDPSVATAFAPVAGGFWRPHPDDCAGPVRLMHTHGWRDQTVPLEGRPVSTVGVEQGDIYETLARWRAENRCAKRRADRFVTDGPFWRRIWTHCEAGALEFALHPGGHEVPEDWPDLALDWFESLGRDAAD